MLCLLSQLDALLASVLFRTCTLDLHLISLRMVKSAEMVCLHLLLASVLFRNCILGLHLISSRAVRSAERVCLHLLLVLTPFLYRALSTMLMPTLLTRQSTLVFSLQISSHLLLTCLTSH